jgi:hypothetical protein
MHPITESGRRRNARHRLSPQERAKALLVIHELIALESIEPATAKRNALARLAIGLPPVVRRNVNREVRP